MNEVKKLLKKQKKTIKSLASDMRRDPDALGRRLLNRPNVDIKLLEDIAAQCGVKLLILFYDPLENGVV